MIRSPALPLYYTNVSFRQSLWNPFQCSSGKSKNLLTNNGVTIMYIIKSHDLSHEFQIVDHLSTYAHTQHILKAISYLPLGHSDYCITYLWMMFCCYVIIHIPHHFSWPCNITDNTCNFHMTWLKALVNLNTISAYWFMTFYATFITFTSSWHMTMIWRKSLLPFPAN